MTGGGPGPAVHAAGVRSADVVVVGAGALGAACAYFLTTAGLRVHVVERHQIASGTTSAGEGNLLVSDKVAGPELDLALYSAGVWTDDLAEFGPLWEFDRKGGFVVASRPESALALRELAARQRSAGIEVSDVEPSDIHDYEPRLRDGLSGAAHYPQDAQVQPMLMAAHLLRLARRRGAYQHFSHLEILLRIKHISTHPFNLAISCCLHFC